MASVFHDGSYCALRGACMAAATTHHRKALMKLGHLFSTSVHNALSARVVAKGLSAVLVHRLIDHFPKTTPTPRHGSKTDGRPRSLSAVPPALCIVASRQRSGTSPFLLTRKCRRIPAGQSLRASLNDGRTRDGETLNDSAEDGRDSVGRDTPLLAAEDAEVRGAGW